MQHQVPGVVTSRMPLHLLAPAQWIEASLGTCEGLAPRISLAPTVKGFKKSCSQKRWMDGEYCI